jgi:hypothetical protein
MQDTIQCELNGKSSGKCEMSLLCANINVTCKNADSQEVPITTQYRKLLFASFGCITLEK